MEQWVLRIPGATLKGIQAKAASSHPQGCLENFSSSGDQPCSQKLSRRRKQTRGETKPLGWIQREARGQAGALGGCFLPRLIPGIPLEPVASPVIHGWQLEPATALLPFPSGCALGSINIPCYPAWGQIFPVGCSSLWISGRLSCFGMRGEVQGQPSHHSQKYPLLNKTWASRHFLMEPLIFLADKWNPAPFPLSILWQGSRTRMFYLYIFSFHSLQYFPPFATTTTPELYLISHGNPALGRDFPNHKVQPFAIARKYLIYQTWFLLFTLFSSCPSTGIWSFPIVSILKLFNLFFVYSVISLFNFLDQLGFFFIFFFLVQWAEIWLFQ